MSEERHHVGKLGKAMYGTRDAPAELQAALTKTMIELGFRPAVSTPFLYCHSSLGIRVVTHVVLWPQMWHGHFFGEAAIQLRFDFYFSGSRDW